MCVGDSGIWPFVLDTSGVSDKRILEFRNILQTFPNITEEQQVFDLSLPPP